MFLPCPSSVRYVGLGSTFAAVGVRSETTETTNLDEMFPTFDVEFDDSSESTFVEDIAGWAVETFLDGPRPMIDCKFCSRSAKESLQQNKTKASAVCSQKENIECIL